MSNGVIRLGIPSEYTPTISITAHGYYPSDGDTILIDGISHMFRHTYNSGNTFIIRRVDEPDLYNTLSTPTDCTHPKKTKQKGKRFKPTVADRLAQSRNSKYGHN